MLHRFSRTELLIGENGIKKLAASKVTVFGIGGVGSYTVEALARCGLGELVLVDFDEICLTNINRQLHALTSTIGKLKVDVMKARVLDINPRCHVRTINEFVTKENACNLIDQDNAYVVDAIDNVTGKLAIIKTCKNLGIPVISAMGAGNKLNAKKLEVTDISMTSICPLARVVRRELKKAGIISGVKVIYSPEPPLKPVKQPECRTNCICPGGDAHCSIRREIPGSISFVPSVSGLLIAGEVLNDILGQ